jgi:putative nucleotidyltransferase with HDIG domain
LSRREEILSAVDTVPALPAAALKVLDLLKDPDVSVTDLRRTMEMDPGLTSNILRLANSVYFGGRGQIDNVGAAFVRLGMRRVAQVVIMTALAPTAKKAMRGYDLPAGDFLRHSLMVGLGAEELSRALELTPPAHTFTAGLVHDIGKIVLSTYVEVDAAPIIKLAFDEEMPFHQAEREVLGVDHQEVGAALLNSWNLPDALVSAVRFHHEPDLLPEGDEALVCGLVHVADQLARMSGIGAGLDSLNYPSSVKVTKQLHINAGIAESVIARVVDDLDDLMRFLGDNPKG